MTVEPQSRSAPQSGLGRGQSTNLADILERVLDRGLIIVGDIRISLLDIELLTVKLRLLIASVDTARQLGIDWWQHDPWLSSAARRSVPDGGQKEVRGRRQGSTALTASDAQELPPAERGSRRERVEPDV